MCTRLKRCKYTINYLNKKKIIDYFLFSFLTKNKNKIFFIFVYPSQLKQSGSIAAAAISPLNTDSVLV